MQSRQGQGEGVLGDERGMGALAARHDPTVGLEPGAEEALDPGPGEVHPADVRVLLEERGEAVGRGPVHPHQRLGVLHRDDTATRGHHGVGRQGPIRHHRHAWLGTTHGSRA